MQGVGNVDIEGGHTVDWGEKNVVVNQRRRGMRGDHGFIVVFLDGSFRLVVVGWIVWAAWTGGYLYMGALFLRLRQLARDAENMGAVRSSDFDACPFGRCGWDVEGVIGFHQGGTGAVELVIREVWEGCYGIHP